MTDDDAPAEGRRLPPIVLVVGEGNSTGAVIAALRQSGLTVACGRPLRPDSGPPDIFRDAPDIQDASILAEFDRQRSYDLPWEQKLGRKHSARRAGLKRR